MSRTIPAIFDAGVFRPLEPVELAEGTQVEVQVPQTSAVPDQAGDETRKAWLDYLDRMESLPDHSPPDSFTNRDHDRIIYGV
jgi:predicted DNA-binding antitoxin AbrB/MazE fold protein